MVRCHNTVEFVVIGDLYKLFSNCWTPILDSNFNSKFLYHFTRSKQHYHFGLSKFIKKSYHGICNYHFSWHFRATHTKNTLDIISLVNIDFDARHVGLPVLSFSPVQPQLSAWANAIAKLNFNFKYQFLHPNPTPKATHLTKM